jgi:N-acetylglucosaminyldiphosphoundecaprenol N-acetyl-beta-D-mannosaminyltransferase
MRTDDPAGTDSRSGIAPAPATILGYDVAHAGKEVLASQIVSWLDEAPAVPRYLACANPHSLVIAERDTAFREALENAGLLVPDGAGIVLASLILGGTIRERVTGSDIFQAVSMLANQREGVRYFFLGSSQATLDLITRRLKADFPRIEVAGAHAPPYVEEFTKAQDDEMVAAVNAAKTDMVWVGMSAPKQEKWVFRNRSRLNVKVIGAVGAVFDFYAGTRKRSPAWARRTGLEWLPRLLWEPRRLWRRTVISAPIFLALVVRERLGRRKVAKAD